MFCIVVLSYEYVSCLRNKVLRTSNHCKGVSFLREETSSCFLSLLILSVPTIFVSHRPHALETTHRHRRSCQPLPGQRIWDRHWSHWRTRCPSFFGRWSDSSRHCWQCWGCWAKRGARSIKSCIWTCPRSCASAVKNILWSKCQRGLSNAGWIKVCRIVMTPVWACTTYFREWVMC